MRRTAIIAALAMLASAATMQAQSGPPMGGMRGMAGMRGRGPGGPGGMTDRMLLQGITLTDAQKTSLEQLRAAERDEMKANADQQRADMQAIRDARQKGDTATVRQLMDAQRAKMGARRDAQIAAIRGILTGDQLTQFDANVAEMKKHEAEMGPRGRRGGGPPPPRA